MNAKIASKLHKHKNRIHLLTILIIVLIVSTVVIFVRWSIMQSGDPSYLKVDDTAVSSPSEDIIANIEVLPGDIRTELPDAFTGDVKLKGLLTTSDSKQVAQLELASGTIAFEEGETYANITLNSIESGKVTLLIDDYEVILDMVNNKYSIPAKQ